MSKMGNLAIEIEDRIWEAREAGALSDDDTVAFIRTRYDHPESFIRGVLSLMKTRDYNEPINQMVFDQIKEDLQ